MKFSKVTAAVLIVLIVAIFAAPALAGGKPLPHKAALYGHQYNYSLQVKAAVIHPYNVKVGTYQVDIFGSATRLDDSAYNPPPLAGYGIETHIDHFSGYRYYYSVICQAAEVNGNQVNLFGQCRKVKTPSAPACSDPTGQYYGCQERYK